MKSTGDPNLSRHIAKDPSARVVHCLQPGVQPPATALHVV